MNHAYLVIQFMLIEMVFNIFKYILMLIVVVIYISHYV